MSCFADTRYGRWTVLGPAEDPKKTICRCDCGTVKAVATRTLSNRTSTGKSTSCGCVRREMVEASNFKHGDALREKKTKEYRAWCHLLGRCDNPNDVHYARYGGRGIGVCDRWRGASGYVNFLSDMGRAPSTRHSIERVNRDGDYCLDNCCWAVPVVQASNTSRNVFVEYRGATKTVSDLARTLGVNRRHLAKLLNRGFSVEEAISRASKKTNANYIPRSAQ